MTTDVVIRGIGGSVPPNEVRSDEVELRVRQAGGVAPDGIIERLSGVRARRHASAGIFPSSLAVDAARVALEDAMIDPDVVDVVIFAAATHDIGEPATSNILQDELGCNNAHVFDVKNACNSFLNGLDVAHSMVSTGRAECVLVASGETLSGLIDYDVSGADLKTKFAALTLGDGGGAVVVTGSSSGRAATLYPGTFRSIGKHWTATTVLGGGARHWYDPQHRFFVCDSPRLQDLAVEYVPAVIRSALATVGWDPAEVDLVIPHQVSLSVIRKIAARVCIPFERCQTTLEFYGNTAAASIPLALWHAVSAGSVYAGSKILLVGGAGGFGAAAIPVQWHRGPTGQEASPAALR